MIQCDASRRILVVGDVFVDRHLDWGLVRLGGAFHAARALHAFGARYAVAYVVPSYLDAHCQKYLDELKAQAHAKVGEVTGSPNVLEIGESTEAGNQGYTDLLRDARVVTLDVAALQSLFTKYGPTDVLVTSGEHVRAVSDLARASGALLHVDADHGQDGSQEAIGGIATVFCSTSGESFARYRREPSSLRDAWVVAGAKDIVLKENRGGSRLFQAGVDALEAPAYPTLTMHSVGVGDCFNAVAVAAQDVPAAQRLRGASYIASLYAETFDHEQFCTDVQLAQGIGQELLTLEGVRIPWERRPEVSIYLAAPDFPHVDTRRLDQLEASIRYHNFRPRRPVREIGLGNATMTPAERRALYAQDLELLEACEVLIAVPLVDDPGTFAEVGWFTHAQKPVILYDPDRRTTNLFAVNSVSRVCRSLTAVVDTMFELLGARLRART